MTVSRRRQRIFKAPGGRRGAQRRDVRCTSNSKQTLYHYPLPATTPRAKRKRGLGRGAPFRGYPLCQWDPHTGNIWVFFGSLSEAATTLVRFSLLYCFFPPSLGEPLFEGAAPSKGPQDAGDARRLLGQPTAPAINWKELSAWRGRSTPNLKVRYSIEASRREKKALLPLMTQKLRTGTTKGFSSVVTSGPQA